MSQSPRRSLNGVSPTRDRSRDRDPSFSRSRSRSSDRRGGYRYSSRRSVSPKYREDRYRDDKYSSSSSKRRYSRSPSYSKGRRGNRSPMSTRRRHHGSRDDPSPSNCLGVFGLSIYTTERQLHHLFGKYGTLSKVQVVLDAKTGRSRGFAFIYFDHVDDATEAKEQCTGMEIDGRRIRVDYSITERAHTPTPGIYMGRPTKSSGYGRRAGGGGGGGGRYGGGAGGGGGGGGYSGGGGGGNRRRSPSPYYNRGRQGRSSYRSRSRSNSPHDSSVGDAKDLVMMAYRMLKNLEDHHSEYRDVEWEEEIRRQSHWKAKFVLNKLPSLLKRDGYSETRGASFCYQEPGGTDWKESETSQEHMYSYPGKRQSGFDYKKERFQKEESLVSLQTAHNLNRRLQDAASTDRYSQTRKECFGHQESVIERREEYREISFSSSGRDNFFERKKNEFHNQDAGLKRRGWRKEGFDPEGERVEMEVKNSTVGPWLNVRKINRGFLDSSNEVGFSEIRKETSDYRGGREEETACLCESWHTCQKPEFVPGGRGEESYSEAVFAGPSCAGDNLEWKASLRSQEETLNWENLNRVKKVCSEMHLGNDPFSRGIDAVKELLDKEPIVDHVMTQKKPRRIPREIRILFQKKKRWEKKKRLTIDAIKINKFNHKIMKADKALENIRKRNPVKRERNGLETNS